MTFWNSFRASILALSVWSGVFASGAPAHAASIRLMTTSAIREFVVEIASGFEKVSNHKIDLIFDIGPNAKARASGGEPFDVIIVASDLVEQLIREGKVRQGGAVPVVVSPMGLGALVAKSSVIATVDDFRQALLRAKNIGMGEYQKGAAGAVNALKIIDRLGLTEAVAPKVRTYPSGVFPKPLITSEVDFWLTQAPEISAVAGDGVKLQLLPDEIQIRTVFTAGVSSESKNDAAIANLLAYLESPEARAVVTKKGMETPR